MSSRAELVEARLRLRQAQAEPHPTCIDTKRKNHLGLLPV